MRGELLANIERASARITHRFIGLQGLVNGDPIMTQQKYQLLDGLHERADQFAKINLLKTI